MKVGGGDVIVWRERIDQVKVIDQKYHDKMYAKNEYYEGALWSDVDFRNPDYKKCPKWHPTSTPQNAITMHESSTKTAI